MNEVIDVPGESGARYRFRSAPDPAFAPPGAGNFVYVRPADDGYEIIHCGLTHSLSRAAADWATTHRKKGKTALYVRLNVSREVREVEFADIVACHAGVKVSLDPDQGSGAR